MAISKYQIKDNMKIYKYDPLIFQFRLWVITSPDKIKLSKQFKYLNGERDFVHDDLSSNTNEPFTAYTTDMVIEKQTDNRGVLIVIGEDEMEPKYMAHEACHAAGILYDYIGEHSIEVQSESHAYFIQWIVECIERSTDD